MKTFSPVYHSCGTEKIHRMSSDPRANPTCEESHQDYACPHQFPKPSQPQQREFLRIFLSSNLNKFAN